VNFLSDELLLSSYFALRRHGLCVLLQELQQNVEEFQREAKVALEGPHMPSTAKLKQLIDRGQNLGVDLSECKPLKWVAC